MKTLIVYATKYGSTVKCLEHLQKQLAGEVVMYCAEKKRPEPEIKEFDTVIVGGAIYIGRFQKPLRQFLARNKEILLQKKLGLFFAGATPEEKAADVWNNFPEELLGHASAKAAFGGEVQPDKLTFFDRKIMNLVQKSGQFQFPGILYPRIEEFAKQIQEQ